MLKLNSNKIRELANQYFQDICMRVPHTQIIKLSMTLGWFHVKGTDLWGVRFKSVFFGPKLVSWTAWGALTPILALLGPFRGVFGPRVGFGAPGEPNFPNNQMGLLFVIPLFFLHLNSWKRYSFEISSPKIAQNSQNWPKMAKIRYSQMAIFWKNITPKIDENGLKYTSRTTLHFDIGLGSHIHEKIFTTAKLKFLAPLSRLLG